MMTETEGPDRCNRTLNCRQYHEPSPELYGTLYNCCCCNTCTTLRPSGKGDGFDFKHCCRCVPRLLLLQFTPDAISTGTGTGPGDCCVNASVPMTYGGTTDPSELGRPVTTYSGVLFGVSVTAELGRFAENTGTGTGSGLEDGDCAWHIIASRVSDGFSEEIYLPVDHETQSCLDVSDIDIGEVEGPEGCVGMLHLKNAATGRIPFGKRAETGMATGTGTGDEELIDLDPVCGGCIQVCEVLCVYGSKVLGGAWEFAEFHWFDLGADTGTGTAIDYYRGWDYTDVNNDIYTIWLLESEGGECYLYFDWEGSNIIADRTIDLDNGCACGIKEVVTANVGDDSLGFTIRCGFCMCWDFYCGTCRCVPRYLCTHSYIDGIFTANQILVWDEDEKGWIGGPFTGTGTGTIDLAIHLQFKDDECVLVASVNSVALENTIAHDCGAEHRAVTVETGGKAYDPANDFLTATFLETVDDELVFIMVSALLDDCKPSVCSTATPCGTACGGHPASLTAHLHGWNDPILDEPDYTGSCSVEVELAYYELFTWVGESMDVECGYIGFAFIGVCDGLTKLVEVRVTDGGVSVTYILGPQTGLGCGDTGGGEFISEECDPYSADTGVIVTGVTTCCWSCDTTIQRYQITVTE